VDVEFVGADHTFIGDAPDISSTGLARMISSLRPGPGETWQVCTEPNYNGRCRIVSGSVSNLQDVGWNDVIMSVRRLAGGGYGRGNAGANLPAATGLELYTGLNFTGRRLVLGQTTPDFRAQNFNDRAMSVRVPRGTSWEICVHIDFEECRVIAADVPDLNAIGIRQMISSARPTAAARSRWGGLGQAQPPATVAARIVLYEGADFTGRRVTIDNERNTLAFFGTSGSIQVVRGRWQLCDRADYAGTCVTVTNDVSNLNDLNLRGRVASLRPR
jgi:hypothetical protein